MKTFSTGPKLAWGKELQTGTVKKNECKCTLQDAARARHCRYCEPQLTIDELEECIKNEQEDWKELEQESQKLRKALEFIKKHVEIISPAGYKMSAVWNMANRELEK